MVLLKRRTEAVLKGEDMKPTTEDYEALAKELLRRVLAEETITDLWMWLNEMVERLGHGDASGIKNFSKRKGKPS